MNKGKFLEVTLERMGMKAFLRTASEEAEGAMTVAVAIPPVCVVGEVVADVERPL